MNVMLDVGPVATTHSKYKLIQYWCHLRERLITTDMREVR